MGIHVSWDLHNAEVEKSDSEGSDHQEDHGEADETNELEELDAMVVHAEALEVHAGAWGSRSRGVRCH